MLYQEIKKILSDNPIILKELGALLHSKIQTISKTDCIEYLQNQTIQFTDNYYPIPTSLIWNNLAKKFPQVRFEESDPEMDHAGDIDYLGWVGNKAFGIQIKPVTAKANFGNYSATERMKASFNDFKEKFSGQVFIVFSVDDEIKNGEVIEQIADEIIRLST